MKQEIVRVTVRVPKEWRDALHDEAIKRKQTVTSFLSGVLLKALPKDVRDAMPEREWNPVGRPAK